MQISKAEPREAFPLRPPAFFSIAPGFPPGSQSRETSISSVMADVGHTKGSKLDILTGEGVCMAFKDKERNVSEKPSRAWVHGFLDVFKNLNGFH